MTSIRSKSVILFTALALHAAAQMPERRDSTLLDNGYETTESMSIIRHISNGRESKMSMPAYEAIRLRS